MKPSIKFLPDSVLIIKDTPSAYDIFLTSASIMLTYFISTRQDHELRLPAFLFFLALTLYQINRTFSLQRVRISSKNRMIFRSNFSVIERVRGKILQHPDKIHFDDIEKLYVDDNGSSNPSQIKYHVFIRTNAPYNLPIATYSDEKEAEKLLSIVLSTMDIKKT